MKFALLCALWLLDMAALAAIGPLGHRLPAAMLLYGLGFALLIGLVRWFPEKLSASRAWTLVFALGISARLLFLSYPPGNDIYRYIWEGHVQNHGFNPYLLPPDRPALDHLIKEGCRGKKDQAQIDVNRDGKLDNDRQRDKKQGPEQPIEIFSGALLQVAENQITGEKSEGEMNVLGDNVIPKIERDEVDQVKVHRKI